MSQSASALFKPCRLRGVTVPNRIVVSPMSQYSAREGVADDWHFAHLGRLALGGAGIVFTEATAVEAHGRRTHGDLGIWTDDHVPPLERIARFLHAQGARAGIQLSHCGRKGSEQRVWEGKGPLGPAEAARGEGPWPLVAPSAIPVGEGWVVPDALDEAGIAKVKHAFHAAARRAASAGFDVAEIYGGHGFLIHQFLSPLSNRRQDAYGGPLANRTRFAFEVVEAVRDAWPEERPLFFRCSATDWAEGGWTLDDTVELARGLKMRGVDAVVCSSGGMTGPVSLMTIPQHPGYQVPFAERVRKEAGIATVAVGLIREAVQAEAIVREGRADFVALARELLFNPNWPLHAARELGVDPDFALWPRQYGWWLEQREKKPG
ncbi:MAG: NADH:flavin oxidoreductase/NADH oxidase [Alphaproteobacteria bacterium]|nr:NADH:flavin oxidoreductase/NADH oxidase [Alphaproteobacteria bacterium]